MFSDLTTSVSRGGKGNRSEDGARCPAFLSLSFWLLGYRILDWTAECRYMALV